MDDFSFKTMTRRGLFKTLGKGGAYFVGGSVLANYVAACGYSPSTSATSGHTNGSFDWQQFKGSSIRVGLAVHPFQEALMPLIPQFEKLTGIKVSVTVLPQTQYFQNIQVDLSSHAGIHDVFMTGPEVEWGYIPGKWIEPLDGYIADKSLTDQGLWDESDFFPNILGANRWSGVAGSPVGQGHLWAIPVQVETYINTYRADWYEKAGIKKPPATYPELLDACAEVQKITNTLGPQYAAMVNRGITSWSTLLTGYMSGFTTWGGKDFNSSMKCTINSPEGIAFNALWAKMMKQYGPSGWTNIQWYDGMDGFAAGRYGMFLDCDFFAATYENPKISKVAGKVGYAFMPQGPNGQHALSDTWNWCLGMNASSHNKQAAWLFIQWATLPATMKEATVKFRNFNPTRKSVWNDPDVIKMTSAWGNGTYRPVVEGNLSHYAKIRWTPEPELATVGQDWCEALVNTYFGHSSKAEMDLAAHQINQLMTQVGLAS